MLKNWVRGEDLMLHSVGLLRVWLLSLFMAVVGGSQVFAHSGGLDREGCHRREVSQNIHCHRGGIQTGKGSTVSVNHGAATLKRNEIGSRQRRQRNVSFRVRPLRLQDGDTYVVHIRSSGIDAPEIKQMCESEKGKCYPCGTRSRAFLRGLIAGSGNAAMGVPEIQFRVWGTGKYGRPIATAYVGGLDVHLELVRRGWAIVYPKYLRAKLKADYISAEREAKSAKRGIWQGNFISPAKWRRGKRLAC